MVNLNTDLIDFTTIDYDRKYAGLSLACMGDSNTDATWNGITYVYNRIPVSCHWTSLFGMQTGIPVINAGKAGETTSQMLRRFNTDIVASHPTYCTIMGGGNDCYSLTPVDTIMNNIIQMVNMCLANNIVPIVMDYPIWSNSIDPTVAAQERALLATLHTDLQSYTHANNINYVDLHNTALMVNGAQDPTCYMGDLIHFNTKGCMVVATTLLQFFDVLIP